jgi:hypothetical protein
MFIEDLVKIKVFAKSSNATLYQYEAYIDPNDILALIKADSGHVVVVTTGGTIITDSASASELRRQGETG